MSERRTTHSPAETEALGRELGARLERGGIVWLEGPLGAGKTLLAKALFAALGVDPRKVTSPTFTFVNEYQGSAALPLYHVDLYRIEAPGELESLGIEELLDAGGVVVIEWAERLGPGWGAPDWRVTLEDRGGETRHVTIEGGDSM